MANLNLTLTIPDDKAAEILNDFCEYHGWTSKSQLTKTQFAKARIAEFVKESVKALRANREAKLARQTQIEEVDKIDIR